MCFDGGREIKRERRTFIYLKHTPVTSCKTSVAAGERYGLIYRINKTLYNDYCELYNLGAVVYMWLVKIQL